MKPEDLLNALLSKKPKEQKRRNLIALNEICLHQVEARRGDASALSMAEIGRICEARGVFQARTLYNKPSEDYRALIRAWQEAVQKEVLRKNDFTKQDEMERFLLRIEDLAIRSRVQILISENKQLQSKLNICKKNMGMVIDQRPIPFGSAGHPGNVAVVEVSSRLTDSERASLESAISPRFLEENELRVGEHGEIYVRTGRLFYEPGYVTAIRKILGT